MWVESPSYVLRRWTVLRELRDVPPGRLLEIGCGAGDLLARLVGKGFSGTCVEVSPAARAEATERLRRLPTPVPVVEALDEIEGVFDLVIACEVLEHIEDDRRALREWFERVAPGGRLLLTVPAHPRRFGASDVWAGHFRRYERAELIEKLEEVGFGIERCTCYGFPLGNVLEPIRNLVNRYRLRKRGDVDRVEGTLRSGVERDVEKRLRWLALPVFVLPFCWLQLPFFETNRGTGYLSVARREEGPRRNPVTIRSGSAARREPSE